MSTFFEIIGALGLFLFGMKVMSEGLQKVSGEGLRSLIRSMTQTRVHGICVGTLVTSIVQSSSATTVMIVSFVNARLMNLREAIGLIMGANLGTTTTFWIVAILGFKFSLSHIALPVVGIGMIMMFIRAPKVRDSGESLIGFGLLFLGLDALKHAVPDVKSNPEIFEQLQHMTGHGYGSVLIFIAFGVLLTIIVQSSSVAGAITLTLAAKGWIDFESAAAIVLGENIGTTITANIAALTANTEAKRAARAHFMFNVIGVLWMLVVFYYYCGLVDKLTPGDVTDIKAIPTHLATFHTLFNFLNICILVGFVPQLAKIATRMVKEKESSLGYAEHLRAPTASLPKLGEINLAEAEREVIRMGELTQVMFKGFMEVYENPDKDMGARVREIKAMEEQSDRMAMDITQYLIYCTSAKLSSESSSAVAVYLRVVSELEGICDCSYRLVRLAERKYNKQRVLPESTQMEIRKFSEQVLQFMSFYQSHLTVKPSPADMEIANQLENTISASRKKLRREAVQRMDDPANIKSEMLYIDILNNIQKIGDQSLNLLQALCYRD